MSTDAKTEVWLRGPEPSIPPLLQPVAHALLQAREEIEGATKDFPTELLWDRPAGVASVGFHLQHLTGVLDRLFTYAQSKPLTEEQLTYLESEGRPPASPYSTQTLFDDLSAQVDKALKQLRETLEHTLLQPVGVGRKQLPSNILGLLFHAAEHTQRHTGQLLVTVRVLQEEIGERS